MEGKCNILIGHRAGYDLTDESYQFIIKNENDSERRTTMSKEEHEIVNKVVLRALRNKE
jgi:hypothetical protein